MIGSVPPMIVSSNNYVDMFCLSSVIKWRHSVLINIFSDVFFTPVIIHNSTRWSSSTLMINSSSSLCKVSPLSFVLSSPGRVHLLFVNCSWWYSSSASEQANYVSTYWYEWQCNCSNISDLCLNLNVILVYSLCMPSTSQVSLLSIFSPINDSCCLFLRMECPIAYIDWVEDHRRFFRWTALLIRRTLPFLINIDYTRRENYTDNKKGREYGN